MLTLLISAISIRVLLKQVEAFFVNYQKVRDVSFTILAHAGERALEALRKATSKKKRSSSRGNFWYRERRPFRLRGSCTQP